MVEGVHFTRGTTPWRDVGWKAMAANLSDVAAMGGAPVSAMVTLGLPHSLDAAAVDDLYAGMIAACIRYRALIIGGDVVSAGEVFVTVAMAGICDAEPLRRSAARPGDAIAVSGPLGASAGGLHLMRAGLSGAGDGAEGLVRAHRRPEPQIEAGQRILHSGIRCGMDVSDGLLLDLRRLAKASGIGARLEAARVPVAPGLETLPDPLSFAIGGGEDYQLLFAGPPQVVEHALEAIGAGRCHWRGYARRTGRGAGGGRGGPRDGRCARRLGAPALMEARTASAEETERLGRRVGAALQRGDLLLLEGELGAGKTTLTQGIAQGWRSRATSIAQPSCSPIAMTGGCRCFTSTCTERTGGWRCMTWPSRRC